MTIFITIVSRLYEIIAQSGTFILLGFLIAGVLHVTISEALFRRVFGREGVMPLLRAVGLGSLIPICSCGVVPIGVGAYKSGAGTGTVLAFMTAAPALSPASVLLSIKLLGWELAGWQIGCVVVGSFLLGLIANRLFHSFVATVEAEPVIEQENELVSLELTPALETTSIIKEDCCCATSEKSEIESMDCCSHSATAQVAAPEVVSLSCCSSEPEVPAASCCSSAVSDCCSESGDKNGHQTPRGFFGSIREIIHWVFFEFGPSVSLDMLIGLIFAATVLTLVPQDIIVLLTGSKTIWSLLLVILVALPVYTCSMAAIPVVFSFLAAGMSPGAAIAFLIGGPATNFGEMNAIRHQMSWKIAAYYFAALLLIAVASGAMVDHFVPSFTAQTGADGHNHVHGGNNFTPLQIISSLLLLFMMSVEIKRRLHKFLQVRKK